MVDTIMTLQQAAEFLQMDADTLRVLARKGRVPAMKIGRQWRFDPILLREWVREQSLKRGHAATSSRTKKKRRGEGGSPTG